MQYIIWQPSTAKLQLSINKDTIDIDCFSLQKWSPMAAEINREEFLGDTLLNKIRNNEKVNYFHYGSYNYKL